MFWRCSACRYFHFKFKKSGEPPSPARRSRARHPTTRRSISFGRSRAVLMAPVSEPGPSSRHADLRYERSTSDPVSTHPFFISGSPLSHDPTPPPNVQGRRDARVPRGRDPPHITRQTRLPQRALRTQAALRREDAALQTSRTGRLHRRRHLRAATAHRDRRRQARGPRHQGRRPGDRSIQRPAGTVHVRFPPAQRRQRRGW